MEDYLAESVTFDTKSGCILGLSDDERWLPIWSLTDGWQPARRAAFLNFKALRLISSKMKQPCE
jgi:hypothetical protein